MFGNVTESSYDYGTDTIYATLASHTAPYKEYSLGGKALDWTLVWQDDPPLDLSQIVAERVYVPAKDGAKIPVFIARRKDSKLDGANPTLLNGYGGFNIPVAPFYLGSYSSFINRGGILVDAGIRGGSEYGERWHEQAMFGRKQATFDDMIAVAEWLIAQKYTQPSKLAISGGSNGGLTVGAAITQRPDLFRAAICQVPLLDMVRFHKFLIARYWIAEYGDPDQSDAFRWILRYSPYQNVRQGVNLPETLVVAGEFDSRVDPLHAKKFAALVQNNPGPGFAVPAVHGLRQRPRLRQDQPAAGDRPRLRAAIPDECAGDERAARGPRQVVGDAGVLQPAPAQPCCRHAS